MKFRIHLLDNKQSIIYNNGLTILECLECAGIAVNYNCRQGWCGVCRFKLLKGSIKYIKKPFAFIRYKQILVCTSFPLENIEIKKVY